MALIGAKSKLAPFCDQAVGVRPAPKDCHYYGVACVGTTDGNVTTKMTSNYHKVPP